MKFHFSLKNETSSDLKQMVSCIYTDAWDAMIEYKDVCTRSS